MSSSTTNYHLTKPAYSEATDVQVLNGDLDIIDDTLKTLNDAFGSRAFSLEAYGTNGVGTIPSGADLNTYMTPGTYVCTNSTIFDSLVNTPDMINDSGNAKLIVNINSGNSTSGYYGHQILLRGISVWMRFLTASNWQTWKCVYNSQTLSPLATWESSYAAASTSGAFRRGSIIELVYVSNAAVSITNATTIGTVSEGYRCQKSHYIPLINFTNGKPITTGSIWYTASDGTLVYYGDSLSSTKITFHDTWVV